MKLIRMHDGFEFSLNIYEEILLFQRKSPLECCNSTWIESKLKAQLQSLRLMKIKRKLSRRNLKYAHTNDNVLDFGIRMQIISHKLKF